MDLETQSRLEKLEKGLAGAEKRLEDLKARQLTFPLDRVSVDTLSRAVDFFMLDKIYNLLWRKTFMYSTNFESLDGFYTTAGVTIDAGQANNAVALTTNGANGDLQELQRILAIGSFITFGLKSSFHTFIGLFQYTDQEVYVLAGEKTISPFYGFKIVNGAIYGVVSPAGTASETTTLLYDTPPANRALFLEARYTPLEGVQFILRFLNAAATDMVEIVGGITDPAALPDVTEAVTVYLFDITIQATAAAVKQMDLSIFEYFQQRNVLQ